MTTIDLNADVGEMAGDLDERIVEVVSSVNIACGGHAGDDSTMRTVSSLAADAGVRIGAHPSYLDREGFGRHHQQVPPGLLAAQIQDQVLRLAGNSSAPVEYLKPHGALYHAAAQDKDVAAAVVTAALAAAEELGTRLALMGQPGSQYLQLARSHGVPVIHEGFADRAYRADGQLVPRSQPGSVLTDEEAVLGQVTRLARGSVTTVDGRLIALRAESVCLHSDTPGAADLARRVRTHLDSTGIRVRARP
jgi:5-oxoprolinase (ATP-hydrolysing) subunit A